MSAEDAAGMLKASAKTAPAEPPKATEPPKTGMEGVVEVLRTTSPAIKGDDRIDDKSSRMAEIRSNLGPLARRAV